MPSKCFTPSIASNIQLFTPIHAHSIRSKQILLTTLRRRRTFESSRARHKSMGWIERSGPFLFYWALRASRLSPRSGTCHPPNGSTFRHYVRNALNACRCSRWIVQDRGEEPRWRPGSEQSFMAVPANPVGGRGAVRVRGVDLDRRSGDRAIRPFGHGGRDLRPAVLDHLHHCLGD